MNEEKEKILDLKDEKELSVTAQKSESSFFVPVNRVNLCTILASGMIVPSQDYYEYSEDLQTLSPDKIIISKNGFDEKSVNDLYPYSNFTTLLEIDINKLNRDTLYKFSDNHFENIKDNEENQFLYYSKSIPLAVIKNIFFKNTDDLEDFQIRNFENVPINLITYKVDDLKFTIDAPIAELKSVFESNREKILDQKINYQLSDSIGGVLALYLKFIPSESSWFIFFKEYVLYFLKEKKSLMSFEFFSNQLDKDLFDITLQKLISARVSEGWQPKELLDEIYKSITSKKYDEELLKQFYKWHEVTLEILDNKRSIMALSDEHFVIGRSILLLLLRPTPEDLLKSQNSSLEPGSIVSAITAMFIGARFGLENLSNEFKAKNKEVFNLCTDVKSLLFNNENESFVENNLSIEELPFSAFGKKLKILYKSNILVERENIGSAELNRILLLSKTSSKKISLYPDREFDRCKYTYQFKDGRKQIVYIQVGKPTIKGEKTLRFYSPCLDLSQDKNIDLLKSQIWKILVKSNEPERYCRFAIDEHLKMLIVVIDQIDFAMTEEQLNFLEHVAQVADEFEKEFGFDNF